MAVCIASNLAKDIAGQPLLRGVSFKLERRERMTIAGRNGAGKTTLLRMLSGEDSGARMSRIGASLLLHGEVLSVEEGLARIDGVDRAQVVEVAAQLAGSPRVLSAVGPFDERDFESHLPALAAR